MKGSVNNRLALGESGDCVYVELCYAVMAILRCTLGDPVTFFA
jgi:hypothetical protein